MTALAPQPGFRRVECHCGCGAWFYFPRKKGRTRLYIDPTHYRRAKWAKERDEYNARRRIPTASHPGGSGPQPAETERERRSAEGPAVSASLDRESA